MLGPQTTLGKMQLGGVSKTLAHSISTRGSNSPSARTGPSTTALAAAATAAVAAVGGVLYFYTRLSRGTHGDKDSDEDDTFGSRREPSNLRKSEMTPSPSPGRPTDVDCGKSSKAKQTKATAAVDDDDDDMFALPAGPLLFSRDMGFTANRTRPAPSTEAAAAAKGPAQLYPKEKAASRGRSRSQAAVASAEAASPGRTPNRGSPRGGADSATQPAAIATTGKAAHKKAKGEEVYSEEIVTRTKAMQMLRALLSRIDGLEFEDSSSSDGSTESDETDVSFNYHVASDLERSARDELMDAFAEYEMSTVEKREKRTLGIDGASVDDEDDEVTDLAEMGPALGKMLEYLDISNEREKLRIRRTQLHFAAGAVLSSDEDGNGGMKEDTYTNFVARAHQQQRTDPRACGGDDGEGDEDNQGFSDEGAGNAAASMAMLDDLMARLMAATGPTGVRLGGSVGKGSGGAAPAESTVDRNDLASCRVTQEEEEAFEDDWEDESEDDEAHAAFMEYLEQQDGARDFLSLREVEQHRRDRRDPTAVRVVNEDGTRFHEGYDSWLARDEQGHARGATDPYAVMQRIMRGGDEDSDGGYADDEDGDLGLAEGSAPWTNEEKAEFEADLMDRIRELAEVWGVTEDMGARLLARDEAKREERREARRAAKAAHAIPFSNTRMAASKAATHDAAARAEADDEDDEWEDVDGGEGDEEYA